MCRKFEYISAGSHVCRTHRSLLLLWRLHSGVEVGCVLRRERGALHASGVWLQLIREASCVGRWFPVYLSLLRQSVLNWLTVVSKPANPLHTCLLTAQVFLAAALGTASVQSSTGRCTVSHLYCGLFD